MPNGQNYGLPYTKQADCKHDRFEDLLTAFYVIEELWTMVDRLVGDKSHLGIWNICQPDNYRKFSMCKGIHKKLKRYRARFNLALARTMRDSLAGMALGEARYINTSSYLGGWWSDNLDGQGTRDRVYNNIGDVSLNDIGRLEEVFSCNRWEGGYGGSAWAEVVERVIQYDDREASHFIDSVAHTVHNNGCCFSKNFLISYQVSTSYIQWLLDTKFRGSLLSTTSKDSDYRDLTYDYSYKFRLPKSLYTWLMICSDFGMVEVKDKSLWKAKESEFNLWKVYWSDQDTLHLEFDQDRHDSHGSCGSYCDDCDMDYDECGCDPGEGHTSSSTSPTTPQATIQYISYRENSSYL